MREEIEQKLQGIAPGAILSFHIDTGGSSGKPPVELRLISDDMKVLRNLSNKMQVILKTVSGAVDVADNLGPGRVGS